jgi:hypothetical protein
MAVELQPGSLVNKCNVRPLRSDRRKDRTRMLGVLFGQGEVLVIIIVTALVVFVLVRRRKRQ